MKYRNVYFAISCLVILPGLFSLARWGLRPAIDFTGGSLLVVRVADMRAFQPIQKTQLQDELKDLYEISSVQQAGDKELLFRGKPITNDQKNDVLADLQKKHGEVTEERFETVGPTLGKELIQKTLVAVALVSIVITTFVWKQFKEARYGVCAILAMFHDTLVLLGTFSLLGHFRGVEVDVLFVTALLTTLSFSVHDTIVVYDRIRETLRKHPRLTYVEAVDAAVLQTLGRSINNSMTIIITLSTLVLLGGETIRWFGVALLVGAVTGTYSSTFTAAPLLLLWNDVTYLLHKKRKVI
jgi:preprotein translocase subunit SecF